MSKIDEIDNNRNAHLEMMARMISHNLRSPMAGLKMLFPLYQMAQTEEDRADLFANIKEGAEELFLMIEEFSKIVLDYVELGKPKEWVNFNIALEDALEKFEDTTLSHVEIKGSFSSCEDVLYSKAYIDYLFHELLANSLRYRSPERPLQIHIHSRKEDYRTVLEFTDNGIGIDLDKHSDQLFKMYKSFHLNDRIPNRAIGHFTLKNQIEMLGGRMSINSQPGEGCTVKIELIS